MINPAASGIHSARGRRTRGHIGNCRGHRGRDKLKNNPRQMHLVGDDGQDSDGQAHDRGGDHFRHRTAEENRERPGVNT